MIATLVRRPVLVTARAGEVLCLALVVAAHCVVLALLPDSRRSPSQPSPPLSVTLIAPPPARATAPEPSEPQLRALEPTPPPRQAAQTTAPAPRVARSAAAPPPAQAPRERSVPESASPPAPAEASVAPQPAAPDPAATSVGEAQQSPGTVPATAAPAPIVPPRFDAAYLDNPKPDYPRLARRLGEQGMVLLDVYVGTDGSAERIELKASSGSPRLDQAARETVRRWRFIPARHGERPVAAWITVPIRFRLEG